MFFPVRSTQGGAGRPQGERAGVHSPHPKSAALCWTLAQTARPREGPLGPVHTKAPLIGAILPSGWGGTWQMTAVQAALGGAGGDGGPEREVLAPRCRLAGAPGAEGQSLGRQKPQQWDREGKSWQCRDLRPLQMRPTAAGCPSLPGAPVTVPRARQSPCP